MPLYLAPAHGTTIWPMCRLCPGIALDLGSSRTRAWVPGPGIILDVPTVTVEGMPELVCGINHAFLGGFLTGLQAGGIDAVLAPHPGRCCVELRAAAGGASVSGPATGVCAKEVRARPAEDPGGT